MTSKNICGMILSLMCTIATVIIMIAVVGLLLEGGKMTGEKILYLALITLHMIFSSVIIVTDLASYEFWCTLVPCLRSTFYAALIFFGILLVLVIFFLIYLFTQPMNEMIAMFIAIDLYAGGCIILLAALYTGMALPAINLYEKTGEIPRFVYMPMPYNSNMNLYP